MGSEPIDRARIEQAIEAARRAQTGKTIVRRMLPAALRAFLLLGAVVFFLPVVFEWDVGQITDLTPARFARKGVVVVVGVWALLFVELLARHRAEREDTPAAAQRVVADWTALTVPGWWRKVVRTGVFITAGVGIPVGFMAAVMSPVSDLPTGGRVGLALLFLVLTGAWAVPAAFLMRWMVIRSYRRTMASIGDDLSSA